MRSINLGILTALIFVIFTSFQCEKCFKGDYLLGQARQWLPPKGDRSQIFIERGGSRLQVTSIVQDTIQTFINADCDNTYRSESADQTIFLNSLGSDSIHISLGPNGSICALAVSSSTLYLSTCRFVGSQGSPAMTGARDFQLGGNIYSEVRIFFANQDNDKQTDSIILSKGEGVVGFKYQGKMFALQ